MQMTDDQIISKAIEILSKRLQKGAVFDGPDDLKAYLSLHLGQYKHEIFGAIFLDSKNRLIKIENIFRGTLLKTAVYPREVVKIALELNASAIIFYHNHPGGSREPSPADIDITRTLGKILAKVDIKVLDHIIVAGHECYSFTENQVLPAFEI
jgi:DNA repair protein RadC